jgi:hypothetical protein
MACGPRQCQAGNHPELVEWAISGEASGVRSAKTVPRQALRASPSGCERDGMIFALVEDQSPNFLCQGNTALATAPLTPRGLPVGVSHGSGPSTCQTSTVASTAVWLNARATEIR